MIISKVDLLLSFPMVQCAIQNRGGTAQLLTSLLWCIVEHNHTHNITKHSAFQPFMRAICAGAVLSCLVRVGCPEHLYICMTYSCSMCNTGAMQRTRTVPPHVMRDEKLYATAGSIVGIALAIICVLFLIQRFGTRVVGSAFSPVILLWLLFNALIGIYNMHTYGAGVFRAFGPSYWFAYLLRNGHSGWKSLGGVVLCITGTALQWCSCNVLHSMH